MTDAEMMPSQKIMTANAQHRSSRSIDDWSSPFSVNSLGMKVVDTHIQKMDGLQAAMVASALVIRYRFLEVKAMIFGRSANVGRLTSSQFIS
jgi:hypothetical protein